MPWSVAHAVSPVRYQTRSERKAIMARGIKSIPAQFDAEFLDWFRERTEAAWATGAERTPEDVLAQYVEWGAGDCSWQHGTLWLGGLGDEQIAEIERRWNLAFPPDYPSSRLKASGFG